MEMTQGAPKQGAMPGWGQHSGAVCLVLDPPGSALGTKPHPSAYLMDWENHSTGGPKWDGNGSF